MLVGGNIVLYGITQLFLTLTTLLNFVLSQVEEEEEGTCGLNYIPLKPSSGVDKTTSLKNTLLSSHLLSNGAVGDKDEIAEGMHLLKGFV